MENGGWGILAVVPLLPEMLEQQQPGCFLVGCGCCWVPGPCEPHVPGWDVGFWLCWTHSALPPAKAPAAASALLHPVLGAAESWCCRKAEGGEGALLWMSWVMSPHLVCALRPGLCPQFRTTGSWGQSSCRHNTEEGGGWMKQSGMLGGRRATGRIWANGGVRRGLETLTAARAAPPEALHSELEGGTRGASPRVWRSAAGLQPGLGPPCSGAAAGAGPSCAPRGRSVPPRCRPPCPVFRPLPRGVPLPGAGAGRGPGAERLRRAEAGGVSEAAAAAGGGRQRQLRSGSGTGTGSRRSPAGPR